MDTITKYEEEEEEEEDISLPDVKVSKKINPH